MKRNALPLLVVAVLCGSASAQDTGPVVHEGIVEAPLERVWAAFTTPDGLRAWLAPHAEIDLRVGGLMRANYDVKGQLGDPEVLRSRFGVPGSGSQFAVHRSRFTVPGSRFTVHGSRFAGSRFTVHGSSSPFKP